MKKKISKRKQEERKILRTASKKHKYTILFSAIVPFLVTVAMLVTYAIKKYVYLWLCAATAVSWFALGGLFIFAHVKKWGFVTKNGVESKENFSVVTIYNTVLVFALAVVFTVLFITKAF
jgi:hypothetical protein